MQMATSMKIKRTLPSISLYSPIKPKLIQKHINNQPPIRSATFTYTYNNGQLMSGNANGYRNTLSQVQSPYQYLKQNTHRLNISENSGQSPTTHHYNHHNSANSNGNQDNKDARQSASRGKIRTNIFEGSPPKYRQISHNNDVNRDSYGINAVVQQAGGHAGINNNYNTMSIQNNADSHKRRSKSRSPGRTYMRKRIFSKQNRDYIAETQRKKLQNAYLTNNTNQLQFKDLQLVKNQPKQMKQEIINSRKLKKEVSFSNMENDTQNYINNHVSQKRHSSNIHHQTNANANVKPIPVTVTIPSLNITQKLINLQRTIKDINLKLTQMSQQKMISQLQKEEQKLKQLQLLRQKQELKEKLNLLNSQRLLEIKYQEQRQKSKQRQRQRQFAKSRSRSRRNNRMPQQQLHQMQLEQARRCQRIAKQNQLLYQKLKTVTYQAITSRSKSKQKMQRSLSKSRKQSKMQSMMMQNPICVQCSQMNPYSKLSNFSKNEPSKNSTFNNLSSFVPNQVNSKYNFLEGLSNTNENSLNIHKIHQPKITAFEDFPMHHHEYNRNLYSSDSTYENGQDIHIYSPFQVQENRKKNILIQDTHNPNKNWKF